MQSHKMSDDGKKKDQGKKDPATGLSEAEKKQVRYIWRRQQREKAKNKALAKAIGQKIMKKIEEREEDDEYYYDGDDFNSMSYSFGGGFW